MQEFLSFQFLVLNSDLLLPNTSITLYPKPISFALLYAVKIVSWFMIWPKNEILLRYFSNLIVNYFSIS